MPSVTVQVPDHLQAKIRGGRELGAALRVEAAFSLCQRGELSTSQAAALAGMAYAEFLEAAAAAKVELFPISAEELEEEIGRGFTLGGQRLTDHSAQQGGSA